MHVVGARFESEDEADAALVELRERLGRGAGDIAVRPLGSTDYSRPATSHVVIGARFEDHVVALAIEILRRHGGTVVDHRPEATTLRDGGHGHDPRARPRPSRPLVPGRPQVRPLRGLQGRPRRPRQPRRISR